MGTEPRHQYIARRLQSKYAPPPAPTSLTTRSARARAVHIPRVNNSEAESGTISDGNVGFVDAGYQTAAEATQRRAEQGVRMKERRNERIRGSDDVNEDLEAVSDER